ncbi:hypothetical protein B296_00020995 [Ensete ventricosum]|uniref:Dynein light chain n=1 Tax=Ensete ventricosum TaxID=4639 RepID=A0A426ZV73_ENSVE|nr:hypothetical protein B296_00020995 [Ensete ventricosum]
MCFRCFTLTSFLITYPLEMISKSRVKGTSPPVLERAKPAPAPYSGTFSPCKTTDTVLWLFLGCSNRDYIDHEANRVYLHNDIRLVRPCGAPYDKRKDSEQQEEAKERENDLATARQPLVLVEIIVRPFFLYDIALRPPKRLRSGERGFPIPATDPCGNQEFRSKDANFAAHARPEQRQESLGAVERQKPPTRLKRTDRRRREAQTPKDPKFFICHMSWRLCQVWETILQLAGGGGEEGGREVRMLEGKAMIQDTDMPVKMQLQAMSSASQALDLFDVLDCNSMACYIKKVSISLFITSLKS